MSPETTSVNRLPMLNISHLMTLSLDGEWNFQLLDNPDQTPGKRWQSIPVPGLWTIINGQQPFGDKPIYTNTQMPWDQLPPTVPQDNPTGLYEREFSLPSSWKGKRIVLHIGGFESVAILYINGKEVGVAKDSHLASEFDITDFISNGSNQIQIKVIKWSDSNFIEDQDQWWHGGLSRSVKVYATESVFIERLYSTPGLLADNKTVTLHFRAHIPFHSHLHFPENTMSYSVQHLKETAEIVSKINPDDCEKCVRELVGVRTRGGRLFILGVGGSAANASHAVNDFRKIAGLEVYAPTDNVSELTARTNDDGWASVFVEWLRGSRLNSKDALLILSVGGGNLEKNVSPNLVAALQLAKQVGARVIGIVGKDGGYTAKVADACVIVPTVNANNVTPHSEAFQAVVWHLWVSHPDVKINQTKWESVVAAKP